MIQINEQLETYDQRKHLAQRTCENLHPATTIVIDEMDNKVREAYGRLTNSAYIIGKDGKVVYKESWANIEGWGEILDKLLKDS